MNIFKSLFLSAFLFASIGCAGTMQTARTNGDGNFQFGVEPGVIHYTSAGATEGRAITLTRPSFNLAGRYGVTDSIDIGARIGTILYEIQAKFMLTDPSDQQAIALSLAPSVSVLGGSLDGHSDTFYAGAKIPLLIGIPIGSSELTLTPRLSPLVLTEAVNGNSNTTFILSGGGSVGFAARVGNKFWIVPEVSVDIPFLGATAAGGDTGAGVGFAGTFINLGVGFLFGGRGYENNIMPTAPNNGGTVIP